jgi:hypothetical protein
VTTRFEEVREDVDGGDDTLDDDCVTIVLSEDFCDVTRSEMLAASFGSTSSAKEAGDAGREDTMQCVEREVNGAVTDPSKDSFGIMTTSFCGETRDEFRNDGLKHCEMDGDGTLLGYLLTDMTESCIELSGFSGGSRWDLEESLVGAGEESGKAPDILTELAGVDEATVVESTMKSVKVVSPAVCDLSALRLRIISSAAYICSCASDRVCGSRMTGWQTNT